MPGFPALVEPLSDGVVVLRGYAERDIPEILIAYQDDPVLHLRIGETRPPSGAELGRRAERLESERRSGTQMRLTIAAPKSDICRGQVSVHGVDWDHARAELGIWLAPQVRGKGLASRSLRVATEWLLGRCELARVQILTEPNNEAMIGAARAAGFQYEGVLRGYTLDRGDRVDNAVLGRVREDLGDR
jgi:RimJ/RimL family protein N-acetyltransferase